VSTHEELGRERDVALVDLLDRLMGNGVVLGGDLTLSIADVDLVYVGLRAIISSVATAEEKMGLHLPAARPSPVRDPLPGELPEVLPIELPARRRDRRKPDPPGERRITATEDLDPVAREAPHLGEALTRRLDADPENVERGLAQLVLTVVELLHQLMERQALRRVDGGGLDDETVERLGRTLMALDARMQELKRVFDFEDEDLNLDLGPLGRLL
jgi:hypothetical protein